MIESSKENGFYDLSSLPEVISNAYNKGKGAHDYFYGESKADSSLYPNYQYGVSFEIDRDIEKMIIIGGKALGAYSPCKIYYNGTWHEIPNSSWTRIGIEGTPTNAGVWSGGFSICEYEPILSEQCIQSGEIRLSFGIINPMAFYATW